MIREEVKRLLEIIKINYKQHYNNMSMEDFKNMLDIWSMLLEDNDSVKTFSALKAIITTDANPFPPTIGQLNNKIYDMFAPKGLSEQEIVTKLKYAISNSGYYAQRMYDNLPEEIQVLCSPSQLRSWSQIDEKEVDTVVMSLATRGLQKRMVEKKNSDMLPNSVKIQISEITKSLKLENKGDDENE